jgi:preprotein translocase subunit SecD
MLDFPRWKTWLVMLTVIVGCLLAVPTLVPAPYNSWMPERAKEMKVNLGLDLAGGSELLLEASPDEIAKVQREQMEENVRVAMRRAEPKKIEIGDISNQDGALSFMLRNLQDIDRARELAYNLTNGAGATGQRDWNVEVRDNSRIVMTPTEAGLSAKTKEVMEAARSVVRLRIDPDGTKEVAIALQGSNRIQVQYPGLQDSTRLEELIGKTAKLEFKLVYPDQSQVASGIPAAGSEILPYLEKGSKTATAKIAVYRQLGVSGEDLIAAKQGFDQDGATPVVDIRFNTRGGKKFAQLSTNNIGKQFAIILDGVVISAPVFQSAILTGQAQISGGFSIQSANDLGVQLQSGKLPVALKVADKRTVGADLGQDAIDKGVRAGLVATLALIIFMIITYVRFGGFTTVALLVNGLLILGIMALLGGTLTLPGIAGFVLTIGAAVDANVLINERIREEVARGRATIQACEFGYKEASRAIFDANFTNVISAVIMFWFGSGPIRGFAVVLAIGIVTSVFTGVTLTRLMVAHYLERNRPSTLNI